MKRWIGTRLLLPALAIWLASDAPRTDGAYLTVTNMVVSGRAEVFSAGGAEALSAGAINPPGITFASDPGSYVIFDMVTGQIQAGSGFSPNNADGISTETTNITTTSGLSGIIDTDRAFFLSGVFLGPNMPVPPAPPTPIFTDANDFVALTPQIGQVFFIGDGRTFNGDIQQRFYVPDGATRFFLGIPDAYDGVTAFHGTPSSYADNSGELTVTFSVVPEPTSVVLMGLGLAAAIPLLRRRIR